MSRPRPQRFDVVATDLDGTLLRPDLTVSEFTRAQLVDVRRSGRQLAMVTGRPPRWMPPIVETTGHTGAAVCANGSVVVNLETEQIVWRHLLQSELLAEVCAVVRREMGADVRFGVEVAPVGPMAGSRLVHEPAFLPTAWEQTVSVSLAELLASADAVKLLARGTGPVADTAEVAARVAADTAHLVTVSHSSRTHQLLEIAPAGVTKATGLARLVADWGHVPSAVVAFGDMPNDIPMLRWAGWACVVAGAHELVLDVADEVVPDPEQDGPGAWLAHELGAFGSRGDRAVDNPV